MRDSEIQKEIFEDHKYSDKENKVTELYRIIGESLSEDSELDLGFNFADRVVSKAMVKPLWQKMLTAALWVMGLSISSGLGFYALLFIVDYVVPAFSMDLEIILAWKWYLIFTVLIIIIVEMADILFVKKSPSRNILSLFD